MSYLTRQPVPSGVPPTEVLRHEAVRRFLFARTNYERRPTGNRTKIFTLTRMRDLLDRLGNPDRAYPIVHITGTKGKGSTATLVGAILTASGHRTGVFTSPHLEHVEERLAIDGLPCPADEFTALLEELIPIIQELDAQAAQRGEAGPTYFEILTAMGCLYFARQNVDAAVIEVGLGGRLDCTNVCRPNVCVITTVSYDHTELLGNTLEQIAWEKAGIIKRKVPTVIGVRSAGPREVIRRVCQKRGCQLWELDRDFFVTYQAPRHVERETALGQVAFRFGASLAADDLAEIQGELRVLGEHQAANAAVALASVKVLGQQLGWNISQQAMQVALRETALPARVEVLGRRPVVILDAAHNVASVEALVSTLDECFQVRSRRLIFATTRGKDYRGMLKVLAPHFSQIVLTQYTTNPRGLPLHELVQAAAELGLKNVVVYPEPTAAWTHVWEQLGPDDLVCVAGSFFLAAELQPVLRSQGMVPAFSARTGSTR